MHSIIRIEVNFNIVFSLLRNLGKSDSERVFLVVNLYQRIEALCNARGISVTELCRESGVSRSSLTDLKQGRKQSLSAASLAKIAGYFSVSVDSLLGCESSDELGFDDFTYALFHETKELTQENKEKLLEMARFFRDQQQKGK